MVFQWFPMVANHWSDDGMVTIHRSGLVRGVRASVVQWLWWPDKAVKEAQIASCWSSSPHICTHSCSHILPPSIVGKMRRHVCAIFQACCANFFCQWTHNFFLHFALKIDI